MDREEGYYWVKCQNEEWNLAYWNHGINGYFWTVSWHKFAVQDKEWLEIDETRVTREEVPELENKFFS